MCRYLYGVLHGNDRIPVSLGDARCCVAACVGLYCQEHRDGGDASGSDHRADQRTDIPVPADKVEAEHLVSDFLFAGNLTTREATESCHPASGVERVFNQPKNESESRSTVKNTGQKVLISPPLLVL